MLNHIQKGEIIEFINASGADVVSGQLVIIGSLVGVAVTNIANGDSGSVALTGVVELAKKNEAFTQGVKLYWDATNHYLTVTSTSNTYVGPAWLPAAAGDAVGRVVLSNAI